MVTNRFGSGQTGAEQFQQGRFRSGAVIRTRTQVQQPTQIITEPQALSQNEQELQNKINSLRQKIEQKRAEADAYFTSHGGHVNDNLANEIVRLSSNLSVYEKYGSQGYAKSDIDAYVQNLNVQTARQIASQRTSASQPPSQPSKSSLRPIYRNGELVGFEDDVAQQSVAVEDAVKVIGKKRLEAAGFKVTQIQTTGVGAAENIFTKEKRSVKVLSPVEKAVVVSQSGEKIADYQLLEGVGLFGVAERPKSFAEKNIIARTESGGVSTFGSVSKSFFSASEYFGEKTGLSSAIEGTILDIKVPKSSAIKFGSDILTISFFAPPQLALTSTIERSVAGEIGVGFEGATQQLTKEGVKTDLKFISTTGEKGTVTGISRVVPLDVGRGIEVSETIAGGKTFTRGLRFPDLKIIETETKSFGGVSKAISQEVEDVYAQVSVGRTATSKTSSFTETRIIIPENIERGISRGAKITDFKAANIGYRSEDTSIIFGRALTGESQIRTLGKLTQKFEPSATENIVIQKGNQALVQEGKLISKTAKLQVQDIVKASLKPTTKEPPVLSSVSISQISPTITSKVSTPKFETAQISPVKFETAQISTPKFKIETGTSQKTSQELSTKSLTKQRTIFKQNQLTKQRTNLSSQLKQESLTKQGLGLKLRVDLIPRQTTKQVSPPFTPFLPPIPKPPPRLPPFSLRFKPSKQSKLSSGTFSVSVRRFGRFRTIGTGLSLPKAIDVGRTRTSRTLAATFKLTPERKGRQIGGIRTPKGYKQKKGLIFIEQPKLRLSTGSEVSEIQFAKLKTGGLYK